MIEKRCPHCGEVKSSTEFYANNSRRDGLAGYCKVCQKELARVRYRKTHAPKRKLTDREHYAKHKEQHLKNHKRYREGRLQFLWSLKTPCVKCGETRKCSIQFHHIDPSEKTVDLSNGSVGKSRMVEEIKKCVCLCSNCHLDFHYIYGHHPDKPKEALENYLKEE